MAVRAAILLPAKALEKSLPNLRRSALDARILLAVSLCRRRRRLARVQETTRRLSPPLPGLAPFPPTAAIIND